MMLKLVFKAFLQFKQVFCITGKPILF